MFTQSDLHLLARSFTELFETQGHIESWAIDLSWDIIARFALPERMPPDFVRDFANVAREEGSHFSLLAARLEELGAKYGDFQAHDGLWESAMKTAGSLPARLAIEHMVHEARVRQTTHTIIIIIINRCCFFSSCW